MARIYGGILGLIAFLTTLARGLIHGGDTESILWAGWLNLLVFTIVGLVIGWLAGRTIEESVNVSLASEIAARAEKKG